jgi:glycosyltransferase 2 family protein
MTERHTQGRMITILRNRRGLITIIVLALLAYILLPQADSLWRSFDIVRHASPLLVFIAMLMTALTYALSAEIYHLLLKHPVPLREVSLVQIATALTSRIAPIGVGTMGLNAIFLRRKRHTLSQALAVVTVNNSLGIIGHFGLLGVVSITATLPTGFDITPGWEVLYWAMIITSVFLITITVSDRLRHYILHAVGSLFRAIASYRHEPRQLALALAISMALSLVYVFALAATGQALGLHLPFSQYFLVYTFSLLTGIATPTPGGLVGVEAGLVAGFVAYGVSVDTALAVALLYRLITYWLPLIPGYFTFRVVQRRYL